MGGMVQTLSAEPIFPMARKIDSLTFDGGAPIEDKSDGPIKSRGAISITNKIDATIKADDGDEIKKLVVSVKIEPDEGCAYYNVSATASGLYKASRDMSSSDLERLVLTAGVNDLYSFLKDRIVILLQGGAYGEPSLPILNIGFVKQDETASEPDVA